MAEAPPSIHLVPHTHWDREWYLPFEGFRERLVEMMDGLIELTSADPPFEHFHLDGQSALIDDYLAIRPERLGDIGRMAREGRISVGPWFTQMDEFLTSGESTIRNLEWGLARAEGLGAERPVAGYLPDQFGHIGQMPQILRNAGIDQAVVWRGVPAAIDRTSFWWEGPDGSRVLTQYLAFGYSIGWHVAACEDAGQLATTLQQAVDMLGPYGTGGPVLVTVGGDHQIPAARLPPLLDELRRTTGLDARIGSLNAFLASNEPDDDLPVWTGELRSAARAHLLPNVYSARAHQKAERAGIESLLERYAEPLAALVEGFEWPGDELAEAWRLLLWNGAHDSVCGCSVDEVGRAVDARHARARAIAQDVAERALTGLAAGIGGAGSVVFNPSPFERSAVPGLGWAVEPDLPTEEPVGLRVESGTIVAGDVRVRLTDEADVGDLYSFCPSSDHPTERPTHIRAAGNGVEVQFPGVRVELRAARRAGEPFLHLDGVIHNARSDHRLRLRVDLLEDADGSTALSPFEVVMRPRTSEGGTEVSSPTWPARGAVMAGGVAAFADGVFEYEVADGALAITLLRCVGTISRPEIATRGWAAGPDILTPEAQMAGDHALSLSFLPQAAAAELPALWERARLPLMEVRGSPSGRGPRRGQLLRVEGAALSSVRRVEALEGRSGGGAVEVRVWNPTPAPCSVRVGERRLTLGPARIETVRIGRKPEVANLPKNE